MKSLIASVLILVLTTPAFATNRLLRSRSCNVRQNVAVIQKLNHGHVHQQRVLVKNVPVIEVQRVRVPAAAVLLDHDDFHGHQRVQVLDLNSVKVRQNRVQVLQSNRRLGLLDNLRLRRLESLENRQRQILQNLTN